MALGALALSGCSSDSQAPANGGDGAGTGGSTGATGGTSGGSASGGASGGTGSGSGGSAGDGSGGAAGAGGTTVVDGFDAELGLTALAASRSVGLEWNAVEGATGYRIYVAEGTPASVSGTPIEVGPERLTYVHRALTNGTEYHYVVTAVVGQNASKPSPDTLATPAGEWTLEEFGSGAFEDVTTGAPVARVPVDQRVHVLLFAEGYTSADLGIFHDDADHDANREGDVDRWVDEVFSIEPYASFREAFVVWTLPRASNTHFDGGDTAFAVPTIPGSFLGTDSIDSAGETASLAWAAIDLLPIQPTDFSGGGFGNLRTHVAAFLLFDPARGRASVSGRALSLRNPDDDSQRIDSAFGVGHAHEFTHAFAGLRDEYIETMNSAPGNTSELSNVVASNVCGELPWAHLLVGGTINPSQDELVGAFGTPEQGYHSELLCLLNGTHDNAGHYGGDGLLRTDDRMCNFCREVTAFRVYSRGGVLATGQAGFDVWKTDYRSAFYERFPFVIPAIVPQTNDVNDPEQGTPIYEACVEASVVVQASEFSSVSEGPRVEGCVTLE